MPNYNNKPILTIDDEEYKILIEACEEFEKQKTDKTANEKCGSPAEITIRNHLLKRKINISNKPNITIIGSKIKN
ncbi:MAG: hypothetical protein GX638_14130, partial [Crenarchaeota archaeon]|nr:hypothetical protein [Thermoproteota archaeon]